MNKVVAFCCWMVFTACNNRPAADSPVVKYEESVMKDSADWPSSFGFGSNADTAVIARLDIDVRPNGKGLPPGGGDAVTGRQIYVAKCVACHGEAVNAAGMKFAGPPLINNPDSPKIKTIGNYWPYASTIFDYVRRTMPYNAPGSLNNDEVYALTAYLLHANRLFDSTTRLTAALLPGVIMPAQKKFVPDYRKGGPEIK